jgi:hypothetical protein
MKRDVNDILQLFAEYVTSHNYAERPFVTAYVDIDTTNPENMRERPAWLIDLKNENKRLQEELGPEHLKRRSEQVRWEKAEEMVLQYLQERKPSGRSVALFTDLDDGFVAFDLPVNMATRLYYGLPQIKHLLFALDQYKKYLVLLFSGAEVRVAEVFLTRTNSEVSITTEHERQRRLSRKALDDDGQDRRGPEFEGRHVRDVAAAINEHFMGDPDSERLIMAGNARLAHSVYNALHPAVQASVVAVTAMDHKIAAKDLAEQVKGLAVGYESEHDLVVVDDLIAMHKRGGPAALGEEEVKEALAQGRVKSLVLPYPIDAATFDALIVSATLQGVPIEFVFGAAADGLAQAGGIGAHLYYTLS